MRGSQGKPIDYRDAEVRHEILVRQRQDIWTPEQARNLATQFRLKPGHRLLDAGCGYGHSLRTFGPYCMPGGTLHGCDLDPQLLPHTRELVDEAGFGESIAFSSGDITSLPYASDRFDVAIAQVVLCHLANPETALEELIRVTRPGGCVVIVDNARPSSMGKAWNNQSRLNATQELFRLKADLYWRRGRRRLGLGDFSIGCQMPAWMEARGLKDVDARQNEKVDWIAPPYSSPAQQNELAKVRERFAAQLRKRFGKVLGFDTWYRAGGADDVMLRKIHRASNRDAMKLSKALENGTLAQSFASWLWCVWGFK